MVNLLNQKQWGGDDKYCHEVIQIGDKPDIPDITEHHANHQEVCLDKCSAEVLPSLSSLDHLLINVKIDVKKLTTTSDVPFHKTIFWVSKDEWIVSDLIL